MKTIIEEALEKATHDINFVRDELREALNKSNNVEGLILLDLIRKTNELKRDLETFLNAFIADIADQKEVQ